MKIQTWTPEFTDKESKDLAYWERNVLALRYADGWYNDDVEKGHFSDNSWFAPRFKDWRRVLTLDGGAITFHIPDDFDVGLLKEIPRNWDGHTTAEKWARILSLRGVNYTLPEEIK